VKHHKVTAAILSATLFCAHLSFAQNIDQAKAYFNAGAQAYSIGQFIAAIQAFEEAYKLAPKPAILFSLAQAERKQYFVDHKPQRLERAIEGFRKYVADVPQGGRRADAVQALSELEPLWAAMKGTAAATATPEDKTVKLPARVMVTSPTTGAQVSVDGGPGSEAPLIAEVKPGKHVVVVTSKGFIEEKREIQVVDGGLAALDLDLKEKPALLAINAPDGSTIDVDGRPAGVTPLITPISLTHGRHFVAVLKNGSVAFTREVEVVRGETKTLDATLTTSKQRVASYIVLGTGIAALATGGVFLGLALNKESKAKSILDARDQGNIAGRDLDDYTSARDARDRYRTISYVAFGAGAALTATSLLLMAFDRPTVAPMSMPDQSPTPAPSPKTPAPMDMAIAPIVSPTMTGASLAFVF
jgi:hypothetical protein